MVKPLVSVIMSTYNETIDDLKKSTKSILNQTYGNIEFIIVDDNPNNIELKDYLERIKDKRVRLIFNEKNIGLVKSLNKAILSSSGDYIARMDADDISINWRLEKQMDYLLNNGIDIVGADIERIDEYDNIIQEHMHFPSTDKEIKKHIKWGSCIPHPTWIVRKDIYIKLNGYRNIHSCEDYDFLLRVINSGEYKLGNVPEVCLKYRVRQNSISLTNTDKQYLLRLFLVGYFEKSTIASESDIMNYLNSHKYEADIYKYGKYKRNKQEIKKGNICSAVMLMFNKYFYMDLMEKIHLYLRER